MKILFNRAMSGPARPAGAVGHKVELAFFSEPRECVIVKSGSYIQVSDYATGTLVTSFPLRGRSAKIDILVRQAQENINMRTANLNAGNFWQKINTLPVINTNEYGRWEVASKRRKEALDIALDFMKAGAQVIYEEFHNGGCLIEINP